ncbi:MAG: hypothetical protein A2445_01300 [Candidatus Jacksonbacteria bacterium RIFOXYC2_FULL_44_29]|nr:MAG: hypothetical protein UW45_C0013G0023 [Parcubacteria group bacterium GW2011_GWC2_44_22]OGY74973.1 MAG: hypothetical protein A2240_05330 [Candidatus Jacksonbacteria bacterium RIFOXYA2_FULL_43_12]OGY76526.1 MAG: hypothetical protein A2295_02115 [Candidatus Jacksonbacteria bacterium RIFOXYB2_FULL_44_15]OGY78506.1 MAG: hypothetical protein A2445_01300 [Candidatus Jacksonbacteria bacterium RIFOXYC2_FULL_44_29]OGY81163.1 MAG: hypothetical protein A2550_01695 [Candidatus Jacksonbacteria bacteri
MFFAQRLKKFIYLSGLGLILLIPQIALAVKLQDPLNVSDPYELVARVIQAILGIVGTLALLNFIIAGFGMIYSRGNPTSLQKYKDNLYWTTLGLVIIFIAYALISYLLGILSAVSTTG